MKLNLLAALTAAAIFSAGAAELPADFGIVVDGAAVDGASFTRTAPDSDKYTVDIELKKGMQIVKVIHVPNKLVNLILKPKA